MIHAAKDASTKQPDLVADDCATPIAMPPDELTVGFDDEAIDESGRLPSTWTSQPTLASHAA